MLNRTINLLVGILLLVAGGLFLAQNFGLIPEFSVSVWIFIFLSLSLVFFGLYFSGGHKNWPWLFPACIFAALALTVALSESGIDSAIVGAPVMLGVGLPFVGAYLVDRKANWWALIPAWVLLCIALLLAFVDFLPGEVTGALVLFFIAIPFLVVYLLDRQKKWALIPAFVLVVIGFIPLIANSVSGEFIGAYVMFMISLPFFVLYFSSPNNWWALLPAGATASVGLLIFLVGVGGSLFEGSVPPGFMFLGLAATFWVLWTRRARDKTEWARYPAIVLAALGIFLILLESGSGLVWPVLLILGGLVMLFVGIRSRKKSDP